MIFWKKLVSGYMVLGSIIIILMFGCGTNTFKGSSISYKDHSLDRTDDHTDVMFNQGTDHVNTGIDVHKEQVPVDILFVVDSSGSIVDNRKHLSDKVESLLGGIDDNLDWRVAVATTDPQNPCLISPKDLCVEPDKCTVSDDRVMTKKKYTDNKEQALKEFKAMLLLCDLDNSGQCKCYQKINNEETECECESSASCRYKTSSKISGKALEEGLFGAIRGLNIIEFGDTSNPKSESAYWFFNEHKNRLKSEGFSVSESFPKDGRLRAQFGKCVLNDNTGTCTNETPKNTCPNWIETKSNGINSKLVIIFLSDEDNCQHGATDTDGNPAAGYCNYSDVRGSTSTVVSCELDPQTKRCKCAEGVSQLVCKDPSSSYKTKCEGRKIKGLVCSKDINGDCRKDKQGNIIAAIPEYQLQTDAYERVADDGKCAFNKKDEEDHHTKHCIVKGEEQQEIIVKRDRMYYQYFLNFWDIGMKEDLSIWDKKSSERTVKEKDNMHTNKKTFFKFLNKIRPDKDIQIFGILNKTKDHLYRGYKDVIGQDENIFSIAGTQEAFGGYLKNIKDTFEQFANTRYQISHGVSAIDKVYLVKEDGTKVELSSGQYTISSIGNNMSIIELVNLDNEDLSQYSTITYTLKP